MNVKQYKAITFLIVISVLVFALFAIDHNNTDDVLIKEFLKNESEICYKGLEVKDYYSISEAMNESRSYLSNYIFSGDELIDNKVRDINQAKETLKSLIPNDILNASPIVRSWIRTNAIADVIFLCDDKSDAYYETLSWLYSCKSTCETTMMSYRFYWLYRDMSRLKIVFGVLLVVAIMIFMKSMLRDSMPMKEFNKEGVKENNGL